MSRPVAVVGRPHLHLVTARVPALGDAIAAAVRGGIDSVQLRDRDAGAAELYAITREVVARAVGVGVFVNDRADVARAAGASGVHVGSRGLPVAAARAVLGSAQQVGVSVHSVDEAIAGARAGADYLIFGHVFATPSHPGEPGRGVAALRAAVDAVDVPVLAIGGIDAARVAEMLATGCAGVAVIGAILGRPDPERAARSLRAALDACGAPRRAFRAAATGRSGCETLEL